MAQEIEVKVKVDGSEAEKSLGTLKQQLKAAKAEVLALSDEFGITSQQAIKAAEKAAELGHEISAANKLVKTFNPSSTLNSTTQALGSVKEGFEVASHTMKTFGVESTELEGALGKVGVAMEFTSGITSIQESAGAFNRLGATLKSYSIVQKIITAGQWLWNAALNANPIGAMVVAITALITAGYALTKYFMDNAKASHKNEEAIKENSKALNEQIKTANKNTEAIDINSKQKLAMAKASGKSSEEIRKLELKLVDEKIAFSNSTREIAKNTYYKNLNALATLKSADADEEQIKKQEEITKSALDEFSKQNKNLTEAVKEKVSITNRHQVEIRQSETDNNKKLRDLAKEAAEKAKDKKIQAAEDEKKRLEEIEKERQALISRQGDKAREEYEAAEKLIADARKANEDSLKTENEIKVEKENADFETKKQDLINKGLSIEEIEAEHKRNLSNLDLEYYASESDKAIKSTADAKAQSEAKIKIAELEAKQKDDLLKSASDSMDAVAEIVGKNTVAGKSLAVASALINTYQGISAGVKLGYPQAIPAVLMASITGFKAVKSIMSVKVPAAGGGGGGGGSVPSGISLPSAMPVNPQVVGESGVNQLASTLGNQAPVKAYVVAKDVTSQQSLDRNITDTATLG